MKKGMTPMVILATKGMAMRKVRVINEYSFVFSKYLLMEHQAKKQPNPMKTSTLLNENLFENRRKTAPKIVHKFPMAVTKDHLLNNLALSQKLSDYQA